MLPQPTSQDCPLKMTLLLLLQHLYKWIELDEVLSLCVFFFPLFKYSRLLLPPYKGENMKSAQLETDFEHRWSDFPFCHKFYQNEHATCLIYISILLLVISEEFANSRISFWSRCSSTKCLPGFWTYRRHLRTCMHFLCPMCRSICFSWFLEEGKEILCWYLWFHFISLPLFPLRFNKNHIYIKPTISNTGTIDKETKKTGRNSSKQCLPLDF